MPSLPRVLAVCVNYNGAHVLAKTLRSLEQTSYADLEVVVVDNASKDGSTKLVPSSMQLRVLPENRGYAAALNLIAREALEADPYYRPDYFLFLNNDVHFGPEFVGELVTFAESSGPGVFGPKVILDDGTKRLEAAWGRVTFSHVLCSFQGKRAEDTENWSQTRRVELLLGCALLVHRTVLEGIGLLDERFFLYHEEVDFLYRARGAGFAVFYCPFARLYHHSGAGTADRPLTKVYWVRRNAVYFLKKHGAGWKEWSYYGLTLAGSLAFHLLTLRWKRLAVIWRGVRDGLRGFTND